MNQGILKSPTGKIKNLQTLRKPIFGKPILRIFHTIATRLFAMASLETRVTRKLETGLQPIMHHTCVYTLLIKW